MPVTTVPDLDRLPPVALPPAEAALLPAAPYAPFLEARTARAPGLMPLDGPRTVVLPDFAAQMARREALLDARAEVCLGALAGSEAAAEELVATVAADALLLPGFRAEGALWHRPDGAAVDRAAHAPLAALGRMVAEDWCLLDRRAGTEEYVLVAGVMCFPSRWLLAEKLGRPLTAIHDPVPDYDARLAARVNRVFAALRPERPVWRVNWLVHTTPEPHLPQTESGKAAVSGAGPADTVYLRTERQTLSRLPRSGAVAFGIKTSLCRLEALTAAERAALARELSRLDPRTVGYRSGADLHGQVLARLAALDTGARGGHLPQK